MTPLLLLATVAATPPNVVLIISDDQAWTDYGFMGHPVIETPRLDRLAEQSICYTHGYVPDSLCRPSLMSIMTGLYPHQHRVVSNDPPAPEGVDGKNRAQKFRDPRYLEIRRQYLSHVDRADLLSEMLGRAGYRSHQSGKWWEGSFKRGGFTEGMTHGDRTRGGRHGDEGLKIGREGMIPVFDFIDRESDAGRPFFVYYAPFLPHSPHTPPPRILKKYAKKGRPESIAKYYAMCEWFDETCGQLLDKLDEAGVADKTVVLYVCDNGWVQRPHSPRYAPRSKRSPYDGGLRTPIMVKAPGVEPRFDRTPVSSIDLVPTTLAACGQPAMEDLPGVDLLNEDAVRGRAAIFGEVFEHDAVHAEDPVPSLKWRWVVKDGWKLIAPDPVRQPGEEPQLYHVDLDPQEADDLAAQKPGKVQELQAVLDEWWAPREVAAANR